MSFRIRGLAAAQFQPLFSLSDAELEARQARRMVAADAGYPCRISLTDAMPGDEVILLNYEHHRADSPFRSSYAIYVRERERRFDRVDEVPEQLRKRFLALRGYDASGMLVQAELIEGNAIERGIEVLFARQDVDYIHAHFAKPGCYAALIERH